MAKVFKNGRNQAIKILRNYCFNTNGIYIIKHDKTQKWNKFFKDLEKLNSSITDDFLIDRN